MNLAAVMDEMAGVLEEIISHQVFAYPPAKVVAPAGVISYPDEVGFDALNVRGADRITGIPVIVIEGKATDRTARDRIAAYAAGAGDQSVKAVFEARQWVSCDTVHVREATFDVVTIAAVDYIAVMFAADAIGAGQ